MKISGQSDKALRFEGSNFDLSRVSEAGVLVRILELDNRLRVFIEIGEDTTHDDVRDTIPLALMWRDKLIEHQGRWRYGGGNGLLEDLHRRHVRGMSYSRIAARINQSVASRLVQLVKDMETREEYVKKYQGMTTRQLLTKLPESEGENSTEVFNLLVFGSFEGQKAKATLTGMRIRDEDAEEILIAGLDRIAQGLPPFEEGYPIDREKVISALRYWRSKRKADWDDDY